MSALGWKTSCPNPERSRWSVSDRVLFDVAEAGDQDAQLELSGRDPAVSPAKYLNRMSVKAGDKIVLIPMRDVVWVQSHGNLLRLHLQNASYEHRMTIKAIRDRLDPERFLRVNRGAIVNLDHVVEFKLPRRGKASVHLNSGEALPVSRVARLVLKRGLLSQLYTLAEAKGS